MNQDNPAFVSRGGIKLLAALQKFQVISQDKVCLDIGSSTGGFVDCLLQSGAKKVYSVDTAYGELAWKLRNDPKVVVMERTNFLHMAPLPEIPDIVSIDAGWTKLAKVLLKLTDLISRETLIIALLKPQYEVEQKVLEKGVVPEEILPTIQATVKDQIDQLGYTITDEMESPIRGGGGNVEYLLLLRRT